MSPVVCSYSQTRIIMVIFEPTPLMFLLKRPRCRNAIISEVNDPNCIYTPSQLPWVAANLSTRAFYVLIPCYIMEVALVVRSWAFPQKFVKAWRSPLATCLLVAEEDMRSCGKWRQVVVPLIVRRKKKKHFFG